MGHIFAIDWDAIRAYASLFVLTIIALFAVWKDSKEYKKRAKEDHGRGPQCWLKRNAVPIIYVVTLTSAFLGAMDIHSTRHQVLKDKADAQADKRASEKQIEDLKAAVNTGNDLLGRQRQDFLKQFSQMEDRVNNLQTAIRTTDLQQEAARLRSDLEATRKSMEVPKATLSFSFMPDTIPTGKFIALKLEDGSVQVPFTVQNSSDSDALEGSVVLRICDGCKFKETPQGFTKIDGQTENERNLDFQHIFSNSNIPRQRVSVIPPPNAPAFTLV
jgi:hypothetical protein